MMVVKRDEFKNGATYTGVYNGVEYCAEFYIDGNFGHPQVRMCDSSILEKKVGDKWIAVGELDDDEFNAIINAIEPKLEK